MDDRIGSISVFRWLNTRFCLATRTWLQPLQDNNQLKTRVFVNTIKQFETRINKDCCPVQPKSNYVRYLTHPVHLIDSFAQTRHWLACTHLQEFIDIYFVWTVPSAMPEAPAPRWYVCRLSEVFTNTVSAGRTARCTYATDLVVNSIMWFVC
jgi:hypothetical protein